MKKIHTLPRWLLLLAVIIIPIAYFTPIWSIQLWAPQYPEGLEMKIWTDKLTGSVSNINILNHYVGMDKIDETMFPELRILNYVLGFFLLLGLTAFISNRKFMLYTFTFVVVAFAVVAMIDMYQWGYKYGHNLSPDAPIKIEGESYQPPLIGYKQLLNFTALSMPDTGGWVLFGAGFLAILASVINWMKNKKMKRRSFSAVIAIVTLFQFSACTSGPEPLNYGEEACDFCGMTLADNKYGAEIITDKGKIYKFDDLNCMINYRDEMTKETAGSFYVADFAQPGNLVEAGKAYYLKSAELRSPMGANIAAFSHADSISRYAELVPGETITWNDISE